VQCLSNRKIGDLSGQWDVDPIAGVPIRHAAFCFDRPRDSWAAQSGSRAVAAGLATMPQLARLLPGSEQLHGQAIPRAAARLDQGLGSIAIASIETSRPRGSRTWAGADRAGGGSGMCRA
jgi:hypothetical protein